MGFSMLEVLTAMAVVAVLLSLASPQLSAFQAQYRITSGARQVAIDLQRARMKAVGENAFCRVMFYGDGTYVLQSSVDGVTFVTNGAGMRLPEGISFVGTLPQPTFTRLGTLTAPGSLSLTNTLGQTKAVQINLFGKITIT